MLDYFNVLLLNIAYQSCIYDSLTTGVSIIKNLNKFCLSFQMILILFLSLLTQITEAFFRYDCGGSNFNSTTISFLDVGVCYAPDDNLNTTSVYLQFLQTAEYAETLVHTCRVEIDRHIIQCGMHLHIFVVQESHRKYLTDIDQTTYSKLHTTRAFSYGHSTIADLSPNSTNYRMLTLAGRVAIDGTCHGAQYFDLYGT